MATAIITGGSKGLGRALARALHDLGWRVVVDGRDAGALDRLRTEGGDAGTAAGDGIVTVAGDVADAGHRRALVEAAGGAVDLLVNNASTIGPSPLAALADYPLDEWRRVYEVNVVAPLALVQAVLPLLAAGGRIVNITSDAAVEAYEGWGGYGSAKAALEHLGRVLAVEQPAVTVYTVDPGDMRTDLHQAAFPGEDISDRPPPEDSVPGILALVLGDLPGGRYTARQLVPASHSGDGVAP
jgi:NAD(P)-dependent dehydrogenase (short-subunit alcohol dehydrogenase family)